MSEQRRRSERTAAVTLLGALLFLSPLLAVFDAGADATVAGVPLLYAYLFGAWGLLIGLLALAVERAAPDDAARGRDN